MLFNFKKIFTSFAVATIGFTPFTANASPVCTLTSHYGRWDGYHGQITANGERFNAYGHSTAHRTLPFGTRLRVTNQANGKSVIVYVNDRGPYVSGRSLDLSYGAFSQIASASQGVVRVCYSRL